MLARRDEYETYSSNNTSHCFASSEWTFSRLQTVLVAMNHSPIYLPIRKLRIQSGGPRSLICKTTRIVISYPSDLNCSCICPYWGCFSRTFVQQETGSSRYYPSTLLIHLYPSLIPCYHQVKSFSISWGLFMSPVDRARIALPLSPRFSYKHIGIFTRLVNIPVFIKREPGQPGQLSLGDRDFGWPGSYEHSSPFWPGRNK